MLLLWNRKMWKGILIISLSTFGMVLSQSPVAAPTTKKNVTATNATSTEAPSASSVTTLAPSDLSTMDPTPEATTAPPKVTIAPTAVKVNATSTPSMAPTPGKIVIESDKPSSIPTPDTNTGSPTKPPSSERPSSSPVIGPTPVPTDKPIKPTRKPSEEPTFRPTVLPSDEPTMPPTRKGSLVSTTISGITVTFDGVGALSKEDLDAVAMKTENWFDEYYNDGSVSSSSNRQLRSVPYQQQQQHRRLVIASIRNMKSYVESITSKVSSDGKSNTITYAMDMNYTATNDALSPEKVALLPYEDPVANSDLTTNLRRSITPAFSNVDASVDVPKIIKPPTTAAKKDPSFPLWAIIAIAVGGSALCCSVFFLAMRSMNKDSDGSGYVDSRYGEGSLPPTQFNINVADDNISMIDDPTVAKLGSGDMSVGHYGDQSVATVDYDYSKAYGGGGDTSVVSSVGGTLGDTTRQTAGDMAANSARAALGANFESDLHNEYKEEVIIINAPAGKLGVVIDTPDDGAPVVHAVKDSSVIADQIQVGDKLIAVDDDDVRSMTAIKVSKLISKKSANPNRKLTVVRTSNMG